MSFLSKKKNREQSTNSRRKQRNVIRVAVSTESSDDDDDRGVRRRRGRLETSDTEGSSSAVTRDEVIMLKGSIDEWDDHVVERSKKREKRLPAKEKTNGGNDWIQTRKAPKAAWSDDAELTESGDGGNEVEPVEMTFDNPSFTPADDDDDSEEDVSLKQILGQLRQQIENTQRNVDEWKAMREEVSAKSAEASSEVEERKKELAALLERCVEGIMEDLTKSSKCHAELLDSCIKSAEKNLKGMQKISDKYSRLKENNQRVDKLKSLMAKAQERCSKVIAPVPWAPPFPPSASGDEELDVVAKLFCRPMERLAATEPDEAGEDSPSSTANSSPTPGRSLLPGGLLEEPRLIQTISCRVKKDKRASGITDIALTDEGKLFVVDRHNKTVKIYEPQDGAKLIHTIDRQLIQKPSRVSFLPADNRVAVTDDGTHSVRLLSAVDGSDLGLMCPPSTSSSHPLRHPISVCEVNGLQHMAALDFDSKSIVTWNECSSESAKVKSFATGLKCPAYLAVTSSGLFAVTDWKASKLKMFDAVTGNETSCFPLPTESSSTSSSNPTASEEEQRPLIEPHGVCADGNGLVFVADRRDHSVRVFREQGGPSVISFTDTHHKIGVPFAVACNRRGLLAIADYVGTVRLYAYRTDADQDSTC